MDSNLKYMQQSINTIHEYRTLQSNNYNSAIQNIEANNIQAVPVWQFGQYLDIVGNLKRLDPSKNCEDYEDPAIDDLSMKFVDALLDRSTLDHIARMLMDTS